MDKKRILYICSEAAPGMIPFAAAIIKAAAESHKLEVFALAVDCELSYKPYFNDVLKKNITFLAAPKNKIKKCVNKIYAHDILNESKKICKQQDIDIIHLLTCDYTCHSIIGSLKKLAAVYYTVHDLQPHETSGKGIKDLVFMKYIGACVKQIIRQTDNLVTCSKSQHESINKRYARKKSYYQPFPTLVTESMVNGAATCTELNGEKNYILSFGNIDTYKGTDYLYEAYINNPQLHKHKLVIAGNGKIYFPHKKSGNVIFINRYIRNEEIKSLFECAICVVYPYISATQTGVLSIAYKFQTPALVSDLPFFKECSANGTCLFFKRADTQDLSEKLEKMLFGTDLNKMKKEQSGFYESHYSEAALTSTIERMYEN